MTENPYMMLAKVILPSEMTEYFDLVKVRTDEYSGEPRLPLYLFFRKCPNIPDLRFSELLIAMVYTWAMHDIYEIVLTFFGVYNSPIDEASLLLSIIPLKQLSGFKWWRTSLYVILSYLATLAIFLAAVLVAIEIQLYLEAM